MPNANHAVRGIVTIFNVYTAHAYDINSVCLLGEMRIIKIHNSHSYAAHTALTRKGEKSGDAMQTMWHWLNEQSEYAKIDARTAKHRNQSKNVCICGVRLCAYLCGASRSHCAPCTEKKEKIAFCQVFVCVLLI